jgi:hypothetical protein
VTTLTENALPLAGALLDLTPRRGPQIIKNLKVLRRKRMGVAGHALSSSLAVGLE